MVRKIRGQIGLRMFEGLLTFADLGGLLRRTLLRPG
jgi:hypothetical protein